MGQVIDMASRKLADGQAEQEAERSDAAEVWHGAPVYVLEVAKSLDMDYCDAAFYTVHSLLREAEDAAEKHERAAELLEFIRNEFFADAE